LFFDIFALLKISFNEMHPQEIYGDSLVQLTNDFSGLEISYE